MERKCVYPRVVIASGGRATCPDNLKKSFFDNRDCINCPKTRMSVATRPPRLKVERDHWDVLGKGGMRYS